MQKRSEVSKTRKTERCCPDCGREFVFSPETVTYETVNAGEESVRLLNLRCSGCQWRAAWRVDETGGLFADGEVIVKTKSETDTFDPWARAVRSLWQGKKIEELRTQVEILEKKLVKDGPRGIQGLGSKHIDLTRYFDEANLTDKQRDVASLLLEYKLS